MQTKKIIKFIIYILLIIGFNFLIESNVQAINQTISTDIVNIDDAQYPGVKQKIQELQAIHPNWTFKILYTDINWREAIANEFMGHNSSPKNLVSVSNTGEWVCPICGDKVYDNGGWKCASEKTIEYMMDARNYLNSSDIFQFLELTNTPAEYNNILEMVRGTFLENESYINTILAAGQTYNVSPYYIVALILQEQGINGSSTISGTYSEYEGYYNIFNINASGNGASTIIRNALSYAKSKGWDSIEKSILGGVERISTSYIARGQNTLYFQKFDVDNSDANLYWHQYQQNIFAAKNEGIKIRKTFENINAIDSCYTFIIPVFKNMPVQESSEPQNTNFNFNISTDIVRVDVSSSLILRNAPSGAYVTSLKSGELVTRLEMATEKVNGTYWDRVMRTNGTVGYAARETYEGEEQYKLYLVPVNIENSSISGNENNVASPNEQIAENEQQIEDIIKQQEESTLNDIRTQEIKIDNATNSITILPGMTIQNIIEQTNCQIVAKKQDGELIGNTDTPGTGYTINDKYVVVVVGDTSGDGIVDARDSLRILKYSVGTYELNGAYMSAADLNKDGEIDSRDSLRILKYSVDTYKIEL